MSNDLIIRDEKTFDEIDDNLNKSVGNTDQRFIKEISKSKKRIFKREKKSYEDISDIKEAVITAVKCSFSKVVENLEYEDDPKKIVEIMKDLQKVVSSRHLRDLQVILNGNIENINNVAGGTEELTVKVKGNGIISRMFGGNKPNN